jgi:hypothetical protein
MKVVESFVCKCVYELDENKRFVYSQAFYDANWLKSLTHWSRDKSRKEVDCGTHLRNLGFLGMRHLSDKVKAAQAFERSCDLWEVCKPSGKYIYTPYVFKRRSGSMSDLSDLITFNREVKEDSSDYSDW